MEEKLQDSPIIFWVAFLSVFTVCCLIPTFCTYVHLKRHVYVERYIQRLFRKRFHAEIVRHIHPKKPKYKQCHHLFGFGYFFVTHGYLGLFEKELPETISSDFEFKTPQKISRLLIRIREILPTKRFAIREDLSSKDCLVVSILNKSESCHVRIRIIRAKNKPGHYVYRLICTWLNF